MKEEQHIGGLAALIRQLSLSPAPAPEDPPWVMDTQLSKPVSIEFAQKSKKAATPPGLNCCDTLPK